MTDKEWRNRNDRNLRQQNKLRFGPNHELRAWRAEHGYSQKDVCARVHITQATYSLYETGASHTPAWLMTYIRTGVLNKPGPEDRKTAKSTREYRESNKKRLGINYKMKSWRAAYGYSQERAAEILGYHPSTIALWECGYAPAPDFIMTYIEERLTECQELR